MKRIENVSYSELDNAAAANGYVLIDIVEGCLIDSVLYEKSETETKQSILIAGIETYLNSNSSCLTVYIARTENDKNKLIEKWNDLKDIEEIA